MADKQGRLAKLLEQEYKTKGVLGGFTTASGKRIKEIFDFRNRLFSGIGVGSIIGRKIFGKGYSATADSPEKRVSPLQMQQSAFSEKAVDVLLTLKRDTRISAKNSVVLPQMARDMNLTKQNIMKLVRLQGSTAEMKADMFFKRASERETAYESQFGRGMPISTTPTPVNIPGEKNSLVGLLTALLAGLGTILALNFDKFKPIFEEIKSGLYKILLALGALAVTRGALSMPRPGPAPAPGPAPRTPVPTPAPTPSTPSPTPGGSAPAPRGGTPSGPGTILGPNGKPLPSSGPAGEAAKKTITQRLGQLLKSPKAVAKFTLLMGKRGLGWLATALVFSGPLGWIVTAILAAMAFNDIMSLIDEAFKEDTPNTQNNTSTSPSNMATDQQSIANLIYTRFREAGFSDVQAKAAVANAYAESRLDPTAHNQKGEDSVGLFQLNRKGGEGKGYSVEELKDPEKNIAIAIEKMKGRQGANFRAATTTEEAVSAFVKDFERPKDQAGAIAQRTQYASLIGSGNNTGQKVGLASLSLSDSQRTASTTGGGTNMVINKQDTNVAQGGQSGKPASTYDAELSRTLLSLVTS
jgi:hypothetical protein